VRKPAVPPELDFAPRLRAAPPGDSLEGVFTSAPPWLVSMIIHSAILLAIGLVAVEAHRQQMSEMDVELAPLTDDVDIGPDETYAETLGEQLEVMQPGVDSSLASEIDAAYSISDLPAVDDPLAAPPMSPDLTAAPSEGFFSDVEAPSIGWALSGRQEGRKDALLKAYGGTKTTQDSVNAALRWLKAQQGRGGFWSLRGPYADGARSENRQAATAMATLAFLGDGHSHVKDGPYRQTVAKALRALLNSQQDDGEFFTDETPSSHRLYTHAQCTIAMCELYAITEDSQARESARRAIEYCVENQASQGGWRYDPGHDSDMSVTGWFVMALQSARMAHIEVPTVTLHRVTKFLDSVSGDQGSRYSYTPERSATAPMTAEALLCRQYLGWKRDDPRLLRGVEYLAQHPVNWNSPNVYHWYYAAQVMHHMGGEHWVEWNKVMRQVIPENQEREGPERGSWDPDGDAWGSSAGRLYMTCLATYMLEVYYRHLPLYAAPLEGTEQASAPSGVMEL
jgi:hypothetical protein